MTDQHQIPLGVRQAAERWGVDVATIRRWAEKGQVRAHRTLGGEWRIYDYPPNGTNGGRRPVQTEP